VVARYRLGTRVTIAVIALSVPLSAFCEKIAVTQDNEHFFRKLPFRLVCQYDPLKRKSTLGRMIVDSKEPAKLIWKREKSRNIKALKNKLAARVKAAGGSLKTLESRRLMAVERKYLSFITAVKTCRSFTGRLSDPDDGGSPPNQPGPEGVLPLAVLRSEEQVREGNEVWLDASESISPASRPLKYNFSQIEGPWVALQNPEKDNESARRSFMASFSSPLTEATELVFELKVSDGLLESAPARISILINQGAMVCGDGICGLGQDKDNCPFDCKVAVLEKDVKIQYPTYSTRSVIRYRVDGSSERINDPQQVQDFLLNTLDLTISGRVLGIPGMLSDRNPDLPALTYLQMNSIWATSQRELWDTVKEDEIAFVHVKDEPPTPNTRLRMRCDFEQYLMYPGPAWRQYYADYALLTLQRNPNYDGIFMDNGLGRLIIGHRYWRPIQGYEAIVGPDGRTIELPQFKLHISEKYYECLNPIQAFDNPGLGGVDYFTGGSNTQTSITLGVARTPGSKVYLNFWAIDAPASEVVSSWPQDTAESVRYIKERLGNYLLVFNGILWSWDEDNVLPSLTDGGMDEQFVFPPWSELPASGAAGIAEKGWLIQVTELSEISREKIFLAQAGVKLTGTLPDEEVRMQRVALFSFASFLLGKERYAYFHFAIGPGSYQNYSYFDYWQVRLGDPAPGASGKFHIREQINGANIYQREFEHALVLVNPSDVAGERVINLEPQTYYTLEGGPVSQVNLPEKSGIILLKQHTKPGL
jgi:hypothetical protein